MLRTALFAPAVALVGLMLAAPLAAQTASGPPAARGEVNPNGRIAMHVSALVMEDLKQFITDETKRSSIFMRMVLVAKQEAIGSSCAAYVVDQKRLTAVMMRAMRPLSEGVSKDVATTNLNRALRQYHTLLGGELAQFAYDPDGYCNRAKQLVTDLGEYPEAQSPLVLQPA
ncbi:MAG: hypothetical protein ACK4IS_02900 [Erythrobacter sp.]